MVFLILSAGCAPPTSEAQIPDAATPNLLLLIHGGGDDATVWADGMASVATDALLEPAAWTVLAYDWADAAAGSSSAAPNGLVEGAAVGARLAEAGYTHVHFVAHSVGGFVVDGALGASGDRAYTVHATFLDPFCFLDLGRASYGNRTFGAGADFAESWMNEDDPAPSTNAALDLAHTFDLTAARPSSVAAADGHRWPVTWYQESWGRDDLGAAWSAERTATFDASGLLAAWPAGETTEVAE